MLNIDIINILTNKFPDLRHLENACKTIGKKMPSTQHLKTAQTPNITYWKCSPIRLENYTWVMSETIHWVM